VYGHQAALAELGVPGCAGCRRGDRPSARVSASASPIRRPVTATGRTSTRTLRRAGAAGPARPPGAAGSPRRVQVGAGRDGSETAVAPLGGTSCGDRWRVQSSREPAHEREPSGPGGGLHGRPCRAHSRASATVMTSLRVAPGRCRTALSWWRHSQPSTRRSAAGEILADGLAERRHRPPGHRQAQRAQGREIHPWRRARWVFTLRWRSECPDLRQRRPVSEEVGGQGVPAIRSRNSGYYSDHRTMPDNVRMPPLGPMAELQIRDNLVSSS